MSTVDMGTMFQDARQSGMWFFCAYHGMWFSPGELEKHQAEGRFRWGPVNWKLRDPAGRLQELREEVTAAQRALSEFEKRMC